MEENKNDKPSLYDYFYWDYAILEKALSVRAEALGGRDRKLAQGYSYFVELGITKVAQNIEGEGVNVQSFELINWGRFDLSNPEIKELEKADPSYKWVADLNSIRRELSTKRRMLADADTQQARDAMKRTFDNLEAFMNEINAKLVKYFKAERDAATDKTAEKLVLLNWFINTYVYNPPRAFFSTMTDSIARSFIPQQQYLYGYKFCLKTVASWLTDEKDNKVIDDELEKLNRLDGMHDFGVIMDKRFGKNIKIKRIYKITEPKRLSEPLIKNNEITATYQLNVLFRGREIKEIAVMEEVMRSDRDAVQRLFIDALAGGLANGQEEVELLQFEETVPDKNGKDWDKYYTYALYLPMHGMISDASSWLVFPRLDGESSWEPWDEINRHVQRRVDDGESITFRKYKIDSKLLRNYIDDKDWASMRKMYTESRLNSGLGLLGEFLAYFYLWHRYKARLIEFHKEGNNTDVDVVAEDDANRYIVQAKNSIVVKRNQLADYAERISKQFDKVEKIYEVQDKNTRKLLFVVDVNWKFEKITDAKFELAKYGINLVIYSKMKNGLKREYEDFVKKADYTFEIFDYDKLY